MFVRNFLVAALMAVVTGSVATAQSIRPNDVYYDFEVLKRQMPLFCFDYVHIPSGQAGHECHDARVQRDAALAQVGAIPDIRITRVWTGFPAGHPGQRWTLHSVEQTYADAYHQAKLLEQTGLWEATINPVPAPFSFLDHRYSFGIR